MNAQFKKWSEYEEEQLLKEMSEQMPIYEIAKVHDRSKKAINIRLLDMGIRMLGDGCTFQEIKEKTGMNELQIRERMEQVRQEREQRREQYSKPIPIRERTSPSNQEFPNNFTTTSILSELRDIKDLILKRFPDLTPDNRQPVSNTLVSPLMLNR